MCRQGFQGRGQWGTCRHRSPAPGPGKPPAPRPEGLGLGRRGSGRGVQLGPGAPRGVPARAGRSCWFGARGSSLRQQQEEGSLQEAAEAAERGHEPVGAAARVGTDHALEKVRLQGGGTVSVRLRSSGPGALPAGQPLGKVVAQQEAQFPARRGEAPGATGRTLRQEGSPLAPLPAARAATNTPASLCGRQERTGPLEQEQKRSFPEAQQAAPPYFLVSF